MSGTAEAMRIKPMKNFGSVCSGIEAASVAWHPLGWRTAWVSEIDPFASAVLTHRLPGITNHGDFTTIGADAGPIDVLVGGPPCQGNSVAGLRGGMDDVRSLLAFKFLELAGRTRPRWIVFENVPGILSVSGGRLFGAFLGGLAELGYGWAYRVLDAQYVRIHGFGRAVPQRRRRVFVVGYLGDWRYAAAVLFDRESLSRNPPPSRQAGSDVASALTRSLGAGGACAGRAQANHLVAAECAPAITSNPYGDHESREGLLVAHSLRGEGFDASEDGTGRGTPIIPIDLRQASRGEKFTNNRKTGSGGPTGIGVGNPGDPAYTVSERGQAVAYAVQEDNQNGVTIRDTSGSLRANAPGHQPCGTLVLEDLYAGASQANTGALLRTLRREVGEKAFAEWGSRVLHSLQSKEVLRSEVYGGGVRCEASDERPVVGDSPLPCEENLPAWAVCAMRRLAGGSPSQGRELEKQLARELGTPLSKLSYPSASLAVRRLTPKEAERLQGFPDDWTLVPYRGKPASDGPRYRAVGNSMAVNCMRWLGSRIDMVEGVVS